MKKIIALLGVPAFCLAMMAGCGKNPCEEACDKLSSCGTLPAGASCNGDCPSQAESYMKCLANLSCDDLKDVMKIASCSQQLQP